MKRKQIPKSVREKVHQKYGGRCAYCGQFITYKEMQVDHIEPLYLYEKEYEAGKADWLDEEKNLRPACRMCNFYKSTMTLEKFRKNLETMKDRLEKTFIYRLAKRYGIVEEHNDPVVFYFEEAERMDKNAKDG